MARNPSSSDLFAALARKQRKHRALLTKMENANERLARRKEKLAALEAEIAGLEERLSEPRKSRARKLVPGEKELRKARLIFNPSSGRDDEDNAARLARVVSSLRAHGIEAKVGLKTSGRAARKMAREAKEAGEPLVIVAGGDGTITDVAMELVGSDTALGILATGTMNNVARSLGIPLEIDDACALIGMGTARHIDMGRVTSAADSKAEYFIDCAGVGLSAIGAATGQAYEKGRWSVIPKTLRKFIEAKPGEVEVELDDQVIRAETRMITVSNAPLIGSQMLAAPDAKMDDGLLDVQIYDGMGNAALMKHFKSLMSDSPRSVPTYRARRVRITTSEPMPINSDMNIEPERNVIEFEVVPRALLAIVGNGIALSVPVEAAPGAPTFAKDPPVTTPDDIKAEKTDEPELVKK
jgi:diacylglycerol kinase (ATP)